MTTHDDALPAISDDEIRELWPAARGMMVNGDMLFARRVEQRVRAALAARGGQEPVAWQWRRKGEPWSQEYTFTFEVHATTDDSEVRPLFAAPPALPAEAREAMRMALEALHEARALLPESDTGHKQIGDAIDALRAALGKEG